MSSLLILGEVPRESVGVEDSNNLELQFGFEHQAQKTSICNVHRSISHSECNAPRNVDEAHTHSPTPTHLCMHTHMRIHKLGNTHAHNTFTHKIA